MWKGKKRSKDPRQMISAIRKFLSGEDVAREIIEKTIEPIEGMVFVKHGPSWKGSEEDIIAWGKNANVHVIMMEPAETYPDPEIEGIRYQNPANVPKIADIPERTNSSKKIERQETAPIKPVKPSQRVIDAQLLEAQVLESRMNQERLRKIRNEWDWQDVPFSGWLNQLSRR